MLVRGAWPSSAAIVCSGTFFSASLEANVCLRSWKRHLGPPCRRMVRRVVILDVSLSFLPGKTYWSGSAMVGFTALRAASRRCVAGTIRGLPRLDGQASISLFVQLMADHRRSLNSPGLNPASRPSSTLARVAGVGQSARICCCSSVLSAFPADCLGCSVGSHSAGDVVRPHCLVRNRKRSLRRDSRAPWRMVRASV